MNPGVSIQYDVWYFPAYQEINILSLGESLTKIRLKPSSEEFKNIIAKINKSFINVIKIDKIENTFLKTSYQLKKMQKKKMFDHLEEVQLFHGTSMSSAREICKSNFNWRMFGTRTGYYFHGQGVYFSCEAHFSGQFSGKGEFFGNGERLMILSDVLIGKECIGTERMIFPPQGFDTSLKNKNNRKEVVKYEDNEFYPSYEITFKFTKSYVKERIRVLKLKRELRKDKMADRSGAISNRYNTFKKIYSVESYPVQEKDLVYTSTDESYTDSISEYSYESDNDSNQNPYSKQTGRKSILGTERNFVEPSSSEMEFPIVPTWVLWAVLKTRNRSSRTERL